MEITFSPTADTSEKSCQTSTSAWKTYRAFLLPVHFFFKHFLSFRRNGAEGKGGSWLMVELPQSAEVWVCLLGTWGLNLLQGSLVYFPLQLV